MDILILFIAIILLFRDKIALVLFALIVLNTNYLGAGSNISEFPIPHNISDSGFILFVCVCIYLLFKSKWHIRKNSISRYVTYFYFFLLLSFLVDIAINDIELTSIIKTSRHWIYLSGVWILAYIKNSDIEKLIRFLFIATILITVLMLIEYFSGLKILPNKLTTAVAQTGLSYTRASIPSTFTLFFLFLLFVDYFKFSVPLKYFFIVILGMIIIFSMIRSFFIAMLIGIFLVLWFKRKAKVVNIIVALSLSTILFAAILATPVIRERYFTGIEEVKSFNVTNSVEGNFSFRILLAMERALYVSEKPQYFLFGIGNITEENFAETFIIGLQDDNARVVQLDTADIAWAIFFIRLGFLGTLIYLMVYYKVLIKLYSSIKQNGLCLAILVFLIINFFPLSLVQTTITQGQFWIFPFLIHNYINNNKINEYTQSNNCNTLI